MRRWVKPGSKGIALIRKNGGGRPHLEYVFDVADTRPVRGARTPYLWQMKPEHHAAVVEALERQYGPTEDSGIGEQLMELAARAVGEVYRDQLTDLAYDVGDSLLEELDSLNLEVRFRDVLTASVQYTLLTRCGLDPSDYLEDEDLAGVTEFSTPAVLHHLGDIANQVSKDLLIEIGSVANALNAEMPELIETAKGYPDIMAAFQSLPMFREWLVEDLMEHHYQDVVTDPRLAPERYADSPDAPEWARDVSAAAHSEPEQPEAGAETPPAPERVPELTGADVLEQKEKADTAAAEPDLTPNVDEYLNLKRRIC